MCCYSLSCVRPALEEFRHDALTTRALPFEPSRQRTVTLFPSAEVRKKRREEVVAEREQKQARKRKREQERAVTRVARGVSGV